MEIVCSIPSVNLTDGKGLSNQQVEALRNELVQLTKKLIGEVKCPVCLSIFEQAYLLFLWIKICLKYFKYQANHIICFTNPHLKLFFFLLGLMCRLVLILDLLDLVVYYFSIFHILGFCFIWKKVTVTKAPHTNGPRVHHKSKSFCFLVSIYRLEQLHSQVMTKWVSSEALLDLSAACSIAGTLSLSNIGFFGTHQYIVSYSIASLYYFGWC